MHLRDICVLRKVALVSEDPLYTIFPSVLFVWLIIMADLVIPMQCLLTLTLHRTSQLGQQFILLKSINPHCYYFINDLIRKCKYSFINECFFFLKLCSNLEGGEEE
ncbi:hypothetical protein ATANTOWER_015633, partial [Ataeniobius toweri]|nr:hypothetical protein [Ataeniobius toweri]